MANNDKTPAKTDAPSSSSANADSSTPIDNSHLVSFDAGTSKLDPPENYKQSDSENEYVDDIELDADLLESVLFYIGDFGTYQKFLFMAMIPFALFYSWTYFTPMFLVLTPHPYWCYVPELRDLTKEQRRKLSAPGLVEGIWDSCRVFDVDWEEVKETLQTPPIRTPTKPCTTGWEYGYEDIPFETVVSERNWLCKDETHIPVAQSVFFGGSVVGAVCFGWLADAYGRLPALMAVNLVGGVGGIATIYTRGVWDFYITRFVYGMSYDNCLMIAYILVLEYVGPSHRTLVATLPMALFYGGATLILPWIAYFIADWRTFTVVTSLPMFIVLIAPCTMPESARWLLSKGRVDDAVKVLRRFEKINKSKVPYRVMNAFIDSSTNMSGQKKEVITNLFRSSLLRSTAILMLISYCINELVYDVLVRLTESFGLDFFVTFTINGAAEIPSILVAAALLDRLGRRNLVWAPMVMASISAMIAAFMPEGVLVMIGAMLSRFFVNTAFTVTVQWAAEILPTPFRATGSAGLHMVAFACCSLSPFIVYSGRFKRSLPLIIVSILSLISGLFGLTLPETKGLEMPQTVNDAETIIKEYSLFRNTEFKDIRKAFKRVLRQTFAEPIHRSKQGRVSMILTGTSKAGHSKLSVLDIPKKSK